MRRKRPLERKANVVRYANLVVIASEDRYAVKQYFEFFESTKIQFRVLETEDGKSSPEHVLARLEAYQKEYDIGEGDEFWLVTDCDHWVNDGHIANLVDVLRECRHKNINVALSNPCFDLWLLLHFADFPNDDRLTCKEVGKRIRKVVGKYDKTKVYNLPFDEATITQAVQRSEANQPSNSDIPKDRPQTAVHRILAELLRRNIISVKQGK